MRLSTPQPFNSLPSPLHSQNLGIITAQTPIITLISTSPSTPRQEKSGTPTKEKYSASLWPDFCFVTHQISPPSSHSSWPSTTTRLSPLLLPSSLDNQQELVLSSKLVHKPFKSNRRQTFPWATFGSPSSKALEKPSHPFRPSVVKLTKDT